MGFCLLLCYGIKCNTFGGISNSIQCWNITKFKWKNKIKNNFVAEFNDTSLIVLLNKMIIKNKRIELNNYYKVYSLKKLKSFPTNITRVLT